MRSSVVAITCTILAAAWAPGAFAEPVLPDRVEFNRDIRPILSDNCFQCHGPDKNTREAGLRLDLREEAVAIRDGAVAIVPGDSATSHLVKRITNPDPNYHMPPAESEKALSKHEIALLTRWVEQGAEYQSHWAYIKPVAAPMPKVQGEAWVRNPIDHFVLARLEADGLTPSAEADRVTLIRRLSFDLIGLPPKPEEVAAFVYDSRANAYEHLVDRLLASEHFGERMAIYWLDLVRYADTVGYHGDQTRGASAYRDYIINAFNANLPFDRFTRDQLAGDLLESPTQEQILATGYNRLNMVTREGGAQDMDYLVRYAADRVRTTASVWMGSSLGCAQCHDHKFDPFTTQDFYSFGAFFADIKERGVQSESGNEGPFPPFVAFPTDEEVAEMEMLTTRLAELGTLLENPEAPNLEDLQKEHRDTQRKKHHLEASMVTSAVTESAEPRMMRVLARGNWQDESGAVVTPAVPAFIGGLESGSAQSTRLDLAAWLTSAENPLTARVFVNRLWKMCFGTGISKVLDDVGSQGEWPTHPELLDHLAVVFMDSGWDIKHTIRYIVTSATYRQASAVSPELRERDPYNRLMARQSRFRLEAELVRDNALRISGLLVPTVGGRSVRPYQPAGYYRELNFPVREYQVDTGENLYRRGVYTHWQRTFLHPSLLAFDAPNREECTAERTISNSPLQALVLMNDPTYIEAARVFAERIVREGGESVDARIAWAYRHALSRAPNTREAEVMADLYARHRAEFAEDRGAAAAFIDIGEMPAPAALDAVELAAWSSVSRTLFNLHETIYRY